MTYEQNIEGLYACFSGMENAATEAEREAFHRAAYLHSIIDMMLLDCLEDLPLTTDA